MTYAVFQSWHLHHVQALLLEIRFVIISGQIKIKLMMSECNVLYVLSLLNSINMHYMIIYCVYIYVE